MNSNTTGVIPTFDVNGGNNNGWGSSMGEWIIGLVALGMLGNGGMFGGFGVVLNDAKFIEDYLDKRYPRICYNDMTIGEFSKIAPKGHFVATMNGHITAIIDNVIVDTFDCSDRMIKCCWQIM